MENFIINNFRLAIAVITVICAVIVGIPLSSTVRMWNNYILLTRQKGEVDKKASNFADYSAFDDVARSGEPVSEIFEVLGQACEQNDVIIKQISACKTEINKQVITRTQQVKLQGRTISLLKSLKLVHEKSDGVKMSSVKFELVKIDRSEVLIAQISFQNVGILGL